MDNERKKIFVTRLMRNQLIKFFAPSESETKDYTATPRTICRALNCSGKGVTTMLHVIIREKALELGGKYKD